MNKALLLSLSCAALASCATTSKAIIEPGNLSEMIKSKTHQDLIDDSSVSTESSMELGNRYFFGRRGERKNIAEAQKWYKIAGRDYECGWSTLTNGLCLPLMCPSQHYEVANAQLKIIKDQE